MDALSPKQAYKAVCGIRDTVEHPASKSEEALQRDAASLRKKKEEKRDQKLKKKSHNTLLKGRFLGNPDRKSRSQ